MVAADKNHLANEGPLSSSGREVMPGEGADPTVQEQLAQAKAKRTLAESTRQKIANEIMEATKELYRKLVSEGEQTLERAKQLDAESELRHLEAQRELEHANSIRAEADAYREKVIGQTQQQAQEILQQAQVIKAEAVYFREKLLNEVKQQSKEELDQAQASRIEADTYRERAIAQAQRQAKEILSQARLAAEQEGAEILHRHSIEAQKILAQAELVKAAAQEQLEAQRLYAEAANLEAESKEVLERARAKLARETPGKGPVPHSHSTNMGESLGLSPSLEALVAAPQYERSLNLEHAGKEVPAPTVDLEHLQRPGTESLAGELVSQTDNRNGLPKNELVLGLEIDGNFKAYPLQAVTDREMINDSFAGQNVLVTLGPPSDVGMIFNRNVDGLNLTFEALPNSGDGQKLMMDRETGTVWDALTGRAISGDLAKNELERFTTEYAFWFAWSQLHPQTEIYVAD